MKRKYLPTMERLKLHNKNMMNKSLLVGDESNYQYSLGWYNCLKYITKNYNLKEKKWVKNIKM